MRNRKLSLSLSLSLSASVLLMTTSQAWAAQTLSYSIRWSMTDERYHVYMTPSTTPVPDRSSTAQITIKVPHGLKLQTFDISSTLVNTVPNASWSLTSRVDAPVEDPAADYLSFTLATSDSAAFKWQANVEKEVFNFKNLGSCLGKVIVLEDTDPFNIVKNSANTNQGNQFSNMGWIDYP